MGDRPATRPDSLGPLPARNPKVAARVINGEAMILTPHDSVLHTLNPVATRVWELLEGHPDLPSLVDALTAEFEVERQTVEEDVVELLDDMKERGILV